MFKAAARKMNEELQGKMQWTDLLIAWTNVKKDIFELVREVDNGKQCFQYYISRSHRF